MTAVDTLGEVLSVTAGNSARTRTLSVIQVTLVTVVVAMYNWRWVVLTVIYGVTAKCEEVRLVRSALRRRAALHRTGRPVAVANVFEVHLGRTCSPVRRHGYMVTIMYSAR